MRRDEVRQSVLDAIRALNIELLGHDADYMDHLHPEQVADAVAEALCGESADV